jgi:hypothetical protein
MGIPFLPVHADDLAEQAKDFDLLILPELAVITGEQVKALEDFAAHGGNLFVIGQAGIMNIDGTLRSSSVLENMLGIQFDEINLDDDLKETSWEIPVMHTYLRIEEKGNPAFAGFEKTSMLPMGGIRKEITVGPDTKVLATYIPAFPMYPPEFVWTEVSHTDKPVITEHKLSGGGKAIYTAWNLDSCYGRSAHPDHGNLLGNIVQYLVGESIPVRVECDAYIDFKVYRQGKRIIIHLINLNYSGFDQGYAEKIIPVGPVKITIRLPEIQVSSVKATEDGQYVKLNTVRDEVILELDSLGIHQLIILE